MRELDIVLPQPLKSRSLWCGDELVLPYAEALSAISLATEHGIAVLGLEAFEVRKGGLLTVGLADASAYVRYSGDWNTYVTRMNAEAEHWLREHPLGENHGYILTSASKNEFASLKVPTRSD